MTDYSIFFPIRQIKTDANRTKSARKQSYLSKHKKNPCKPMIYRGLAEKERFELSLRFTRTTPLAGEPLRPLGYFSTWLANAFRKGKWRRERDSNPRCLSASLVFKTSAINHSAIPPCVAVRRPSRKHLIIITGLRPLVNPFPEKISKSHPNIA